VRAVNSGCGAIAVDQEDGFLYEHSQ